MTLREVSQATEQQSSALSSPDGGGGEVREGEVKGAGGLGGP